MPEETPPTPDTPRAGRVRVPQHVVHRAFPSETVVLNLQTGKYHGLNPTGGHMLEALERFGAIPDAAAQLAGEYGKAPDEVEQDLREFCRDLATRGLIELDDDGLERS